jgi:hypothetical protein
MDTLEKATLTANCHCKAVRLTFPSPAKPLNECLCSICRRYGALWAYFDQEEVQIEGGPTEFYVWGDKGIEFHRCKKCGCMTHWEPADKTGKRIGVNCRMLEREDVEKLEVRKSDGPKK